MKFEIPTVEIKRFDIEDIMTVSTAYENPTQAPETTCHCPMDYSGGSCFGDD